MLASHYYEGLVEAGCDEAGRGCLAGSVYAAAVIFPDDYQNAELNDSKQLTDKKRHQLRDIIQRDALAWAVGIVTPEEIDKINILNASILAKTYRDDYMDQLAEEYPQYDWKSNKGYPTKKHRAAIKAYGITPYHRKSYNLLGSEELSLNFEF